MKKILLFSSLYLLTLCAVAQTATMTEAISLRDGDAYQMLGKYKDHFLLYLDQVNDISIISYNEDMTEEWRKELEFETRNPTIIDAVRGAKDFSIIYKYWKKGATHIRARKYDEKAKLIDSSLVVDIPNWASSSNYEIELSQDLSKVLLYDFNSFNKLDLIVYDLKEMKTLWTKEVRLDGLDFPRDFLQLMIANDGTFYSIFFKDNYRFNRKKARIVTLRIQDDFIQYTPYLTNQKLIYDAYFEVDNLNQKLTGTGLFDDKRTTRAKGAFYLSIDHRNPTSFVFKSYNFGSKFIASIEGEASTKKETFSDAVVNNNILRRDGGSVMVVEKRKVFSNGTAGNPFGSNRNQSMSSRTYTDYNVDDIVLVSFGPDGLVDWKGILPKKQFSQNDEARYSSYFIFKNRGSIRFLYNDEIKRENSISEYVLFSNGTNQRTNILNTDDKKLQLRFKDALQITGSEILVPSQFRKDLRLVRLKY